MFFYFQQEGGHDKWHHALLAARDEIVKTRHPRYVTALALSRPIDAELTSEDIDRIKYAGPFYVDFDAKELATAIEQLHAFLELLEEKGVDASTLYLYASGGRGFHIEVPMQTFLGDKLPKDGIQHLPYIYKEMARAVYVDTMDLRVYTAKKGRMWRTPNVQRENGAFKVPISLAEAHSMTEERYAQLCAAPRQYLSAAAYSEVGGDDRYVPLPDAPRQSLAFAQIYAEAMLKVRDGLARRKKGAKQAEALAKFKGEFPPTLVEMLGNRNLKDDAGWNQIAMQIAITANALGKPHDEVIEAARELIDNHQGNGSRYATAQQREQELRVQLAYTHDNPCYQFSAGAIKVLMAEGYSAADLDGVTDVGALEDIAKATAEAVDPDGDGAVDELVQGIVVGVNGIRQDMGKNGWVTWTHVGFDDIALVMKAKDGLPLVFEADMYVKGAPRGRVAVPLESFLSRQKFHAFITAMTGASFQGTDATVAAIQAAFFAKAKAHEKEHAMEFILHREGLDLVQIPANMEVPEVAREAFPVWVTVNGCEAPKHITEAGLKFRFFGDPNPAGEHKTDLYYAPRDVDVEKLKKLLLSIFNLNRPRTIGAMLGWLSACHGRMFYHRLRGAFPILGVAGEPGSGKTTTLRSLGKLHFYKVDFPELAAFTGTPYAIEAGIVSSCSVPLQLSEYKPRESTQERVGKLRGMFRSAYDNGVLRKGGGRQLALASGREINESSLSAPIVLVGLQLETQTEMEERMVQCVFDKGGQQGREKHLAVVMRDNRLLSSVGARLVRMLLNVTLDQFADSFEKDYATMHERLYSGSNSRIVYNYAVTLHGLTLFQETVESFGITEFGEEFQRLREAVLEGPMLSGGEELPAGDGSLRKFEAKSEVSKTFSDFAVMSLTGNDFDGTRLKLGDDYAYSEVGGEDVLELCVPRVWAKYEEWCARRRRAPLYDSEQSFSFALRNFVAYLDSTPEKIKDADGVMRFRVEAMKMARAGVPRKPG